MQSSCKSSACSRNQTTFKWHDSVDCCASLGHGTSEPLVHGSIEPYTLMRVIAKSETMNISLPLRPPQNSLARNIQSHPIGTCFDSSAPYISVGALITVVFFCILQYVLPSEVFAFHGVSLGSRGLLFRMHTMPPYHLVAVTSSVAGARRHTHSAAPCLQELSLGFRPGLETALFVLIWFLYWPGVV